VLYRAHPVQESARFNTIITMINLAVVVFVVCAGMPYAAGSNFDPFAPFGVHGIFSAASVVFFSFIGFDVIATTAEEVSCAPCCCCCYIVRWAYRCA
jgi:basic amino acid/polyamine antiporter, APA family